VTLGGQQFPLCRALGRGDQRHRDADGAGIYSRRGSLTLTRTVVSGNHATAAAPDGRYAEGAAIFAGYVGGIWNGATFTGPPVQLTLQYTAAISNSLTGSPGFTVQGGGLDPSRKRYTPGPGRHADRELS
jgi:hypothetical protein